MICTMQTWSGKAFDILNPTADMFDLHDIAHQLANKCRFQGATREYYSVAQHSVLVCDQLPLLVLKLQGLLHEIGEAYLADVPTPVKKLWAGFKQCEEKIMEVGFRRYGVLTPMQDDVHEVDHRMMVTEAMQLKHWTREYQESPFFAYRAFDIVIDPLSPRVAAQVFLAQCEQLGLEV